MRRLIPLLLDVGLSPAAYYGLHALGFDTYVSLVAATALAALRVLYTVLRNRRIDTVAAFMLVSYACGLALSTLTGDQRFLLAKDPAMSTVIGLAILISCAFGRPAMFAISKKFRATDPAEAARWDGLFEREAGLRRVYLVSSLVWGAGLIAESVLRIALIYLLPIDVTAALSQVVEFAAIGLILGWAMWYRTRPGSKESHALLRANPTTEGSPQPGSMQPDSMQPDSMQRGSMQRGSMQRDSTQRGSMQRGSMQRDSTQRGSMQRDSTQRDSTQPIAPHRGALPLGGRPTDAG
ncbi:hypothetical protein F0L68_39145 [Solihabitans fulvus]|uniref:Intracellular septation protein A n=1 Tax=Solihabitans fulvus TaxID=1892852 RepID=A0A5B2WHN4_9PSEU|nr:VC0807 family protein [Solihabitans fulvus]KAA2250162.1 hypothetical protein F0L68_39145 [Solihabitans fulvus]